MIVRLTRDDRLVLSSVVAEEILAGAKDTQRRREYREYFHRFEQLGLSVVPTSEDWIRAGELLSRRAEGWGAIDASKHQNDVLIALSALRRGAELLTRNLRDMTNWARMLGTGGRTVAVRSPQAFS